MRHDEIKEAVVLVREENKKEKYLCAYIVCAGNDMVPSPLELREYLSIGLPDYMIPSCFVVLEKIPLTANGKALTEGYPQGLIRLLSETKYGEVLGVQIIAQHATDMIAEASAIIQLEGTVYDVAQTIHAHPTVSEVFMEAGFAATDQPIHK